MARGRMLNQTVCASLKFQHLPDDTCRLLATWIIPHLDLNGVFYADPAMVKSAVFPRRDDINSDHVEAYLDAIEDIGLIVRFRANGDLWQWWPGFSDNQVGLRRDRESTNYPPPPVENDGMHPAPIPPSDGTKPAEENLREENLREDPAASASVPVGDPDLDDIDWHDGTEDTKQEQPPIPSDPIEHALDWERRNNGKRPMSIPAAAGGGDPYADAMYATWVKGKGIDPSLVPKEEADKTYKRLAKVAEKWHHATPQQCAEAVAMLFTDERYKWYTYTDPVVEQFKRDWKDALLRVLSGEAHTVARIRN